MYSPLVETYKKHYPDDFNRLKNAWEEAINSENKSINIGTITNYSTTDFVSFEDFILSFVSGEILSNLYLADATLALVNIKSV